MNAFKIFALITALTFFATACNEARTDEVTQTSTVQNDLPERINNQDVSSDEFYARENLDLRAVGEILKESDTAEDFERRLNSENGINNLDLNSDGYVDYISVEEFEDPDSGYRGFSLLDKFGSGAIQEIATIILHRAFNDGRGSRVYIDGNDQIYGDDHFYEAEWKDATIDIVQWAFSDRKGYYRSPYYYENYPDHFEIYEAVDTPVYISRIRKTYAQPVFIQTNPAMTKIKYKSPYKDKYYDKIYAKLAKPNDAQKEFRKNNPKPPDFDPYTKKKDKNLPPGLSKRSDDDDEVKSKKPHKEDKIGKAKDDSFEKAGKKPEKSDKPGNAEKNTSRGKDKKKGNGKGKGRDKRES